MRELLKMNNSEDQVRLCKVKSGDEKRFVNN